jgi:hypothetical protein
MKQLEDLGVAVAVLGRMFSASAIQGMLNACAAFKESLDSGKVVDRPELLVAFDQLNDLMGFPKIKELERRYLTEEQLASKYGK